MWKYRNKVSSIQYSKIPLHVVVSTSISLKHICFKWKTHSKSFYLSKHLLNREDVIRISYGCFSGSETCSRITLIVYPNGKTMLIQNTMNEEMQIENMEPAVEVKKILEATSQ